jgi:L-histidine N-alpha-methyltransferase
MKENGQKVHNRIPRDDGRIDTVEAFARDVRIGLSKSPKSLPCIYFYDSAGSRFFEWICRQPEYYCTRAEAEILQKHAGDIAACFSGPTQIVELGSGSSVKTRTLLEAFINSETPTTYLPIDISPGILTESAAGLRRAYPELNVKPIAARYEDGLSLLDPTHENILLIWLGSSIGNYERERAKKFIAGLSHQLSSGDRLLLGIDLIKDALILEAAYNDRAGITAAFNLNILKRINRELGGNFRIDQFKHRAVFNTALGRIEMYLISCCDQEVWINEPSLNVSFSKGESIHTENSYKYSTGEIEALGKSAGLRLLHQWLDSGQLFSLNLFEV